jgi:hypothetical protein
MLTPVEAGAYLGLVAARAAAGHAQFEELEASMDWEEGPLAVYGHLALEFGLRLTAMQEEWARWATEQIEARGAGE